MCRTIRFLLPPLAAFVITLAPATALARTSLDPMLKRYLSGYGLPAVAAAVVKEGRIVAAGAVGTRRIRMNIPVTLNDRFHIGSDTKAMTALLAATMVEAGKLRWNSTMTEVFPELSGTMDPRLRGVTLKQLLSHTSGIPSDSEQTVHVYLDATAHEGNLNDLRYWLVRQWSTHPLQAEPGTRFAYSNMGYVFAGAMIERVAGKSWDELITQRIFMPLNLRTAGLGNQASLGKVDAPLGHVVVGGKTVAMLPGPNGDNLSILGPAGIVHMSILDFARWAGWNTGEGKRGPPLVSPATLRQLHTPIIAVPTRKDAPRTTPRDGKYGYGWGQGTPAWAPYPLHQHTGSNGMNLAQIWLDTRRDFAMVMVTNIGTERASTALSALARDLYQDFMTK